MLIYMVYDKKSGDIVHVHRAVDVAGRSEACSPDEVLAALPGSLDPKAVAVVPAELDEIPSGRDMQFSVDVKSGALLRTPVRQQANTPTRASARQGSTRQTTTRRRSRSK
jgi:hypothetical protein